MKGHVILEGVIGAVAIVATAILAPIMRSLNSLWGATDEEVSLAIPGDNLVPQPKSQLTMGVTVEASATTIWPWLEQRGCQRAGGRKQRRPVRITCTLTHNIIW